MAAKAVKEARERRDHQLSFELSHAFVGLHLLRQHRLASTPKQRVLTCAKTLILRFSPHAHSLLLSVVSYSTSVVW